jgi:hypothetical protein
VKKIITLILPAFALLAATPALSQDTMGPQVGGPQVGGPQAGDEKINQLIIYGDDPCPQSKGEEIVVCARLAEEERYRIPTKLRGVEVDVTKQAWTQKVLAYENVAATGTMSCSAAGAGGFTGCGLKDINEAYGEKGQSVGLAFGRLIAAEREKRLSGIDAESNLVEGRVVEEEQAAAAKKLQAQGNSTVANPADEVDAGPLPTPQ